MNGYGSATGARPAMPSEFILFAIASTRFTIIFFLFEIEGMW